jgi:hypothetical protein
LTSTPRSAWQPRLLLELRSGRKLRVAVDFAGTTMKTVRRHMIRDADELGAEHPEALAVLIRSAVELHRATNERRRAQLRRAVEVELARERDRRSEHARAAANARWGAR